MNEVMKTTARLMKISSTGTVKEHLKKKKKSAFYVQRCKSGR